MASIAQCNLVKLCVGAEGVADLAAWQTSRTAAEPGGLPRHVTRMWPKRAAELLDGGSLYWVFRGAILARQRIVGLEPVEGDNGTRRCAIVLDPAIVRTRPVPRRPFQGWRYLAREECPLDLPDEREADDFLPPELDRALAELGVL